MLDIVLGAERKKTFQCCSPQDENSVNILFIEPTISSQSNKNIFEIRRQLLLCRICVQEIILPSLEARC